MWSRVASSGSIGWHRHGHRWIGGVYGDKDDDLHHHSVCWTVPQIVTHAVVVHPAGNTSHLGTTELKAVDGAASASQTRTPLSAHADDALPPFVGVDTSLLMMLVTAVTVWDVHWAASATAAGRGELTHVVVPACTSLVLHLCSELGKDVRWELTGGERTGSSRGKSVVRCVGMVGEQGVAVVYGCHGRVLV